MSVQNFKQLECPICGDEYDTDTKVPRVVQCGHSVCSNCSTRLIDDSSNSSRSCNVISTTDEPLPKDTTLSDQQKQETETAEILKCTNCGIVATESGPIREDSFWDCKDCAMLVCPTCAMKSHRSHQVIDMIQSRADRLSKLDAQYNALECHKSDVEECQARIHDGLKAAQNVFDKTMEKLEQCRSTITNTYNHLRKRCLDVANELNRDEEKLRDVLGEWKQRRGRSKEAGVVNATLISSGFSFTEFSKNFDALLDPGSDIHNHQWLARSLKSKLADYLTLMMDFELDLAKTATGIASNESEGFFGPGLLGLPHNVIHDICQLLTTTDKASFSSVGSKRLYDICRPLWYAAPHNTFGCFLKSSKDIEAFSKLNFQDPTGFADRSMIRPFCDLGNKFQPAVCNHMRNLYLNFEDCFTGSVVKNLKTVADVIPAVDHLTIQLPISKITNVRRQFVQQPWELRNLFMCGDAIPGDIFILLSPCVTNLVTFKFSSGSAEWVTIPTQFFASCQNTLEALHMDFSKPVCSMGDIIARLKRLNKLTLRGNPVLNFDRSKLSASISTLDLGSNYNKR